MAGAFTDAPGYRFAYDKDGTAMVYYGTGGGNSQIFTAPNNDVVIVNTNQYQGRIRPAALAGSGAHLCMLFPEPRDINGYFICNNATGKIDVSSNTINGQDGIWTSVANPFIFTNSNSTPMSPAYRTVQPVNWTAVNAIRFYIQDWLTAIHLYGSIPTTGSPDRLRIVDLSGNDIAAQFDFGDIRQRNNVTKQFKVVNNSSTKTANNITITLDTNPDATPTLVGQYQLSTDNTAFANAINIGTLAPGASSGTLYARDTVSATAQLGPWALRLIATANTWS